MFQLCYRGHTAEVLCVQFDEEKILSGSADNTIKVSIFCCCRVELVFSDKSKVDYLRIMNKPSQQLHFQN